MLECTFFRRVLHTCQHPERFDINIIVLPDTLVNPESRFSQKTHCIAFFHRLCWSDQASHERKHLPGDQQWLVAKKPSVCGHSLRGKTVSPEPGICFHSGVPGVG